MDIFANLVAIVHLGYFAFVVGGFIFLVVGMIQREAWIWNPWFRITHFLSVAVVLFEDVFQLQCPLNTLEANLHAAAPDSASSETGNFLNLLLHHTLSEQVLDAVYWTLGAILLLLLFLRPPRFRSTFRVRSS